MAIQPSRVLANCPICRVDYVDARISLIGEQGDAKLYHCSCGACGHAVLAIMLEASGWVSSVGVVTDLEAEDAARYRTLATLNADECIKLYRAIEGDGRAFCQALATSSSKSKKA